MKKILLLSTCVTALNFTASAEVNVYPQGSCCGAWSITWDLPKQRLHFETAFDYGYTVWVFDVAQVTTVTYDAEWLAATGGPPRVEGTGSYGFAPIATGFDGTDFWSGTFEILPGSYLVTFYEFEGTLTFGDSCVTDSDGDGVCDGVDGCPMDADKSDPGNCGCGVPETNVFGDLDCDGDYDIDDARLAMTTFGIEEAEEDTCPADVDGDGSIGFSDVLVILNDWGACP